MLPHPHPQAYFKMNNVLIDDRRIKVDFSQSVSHLWKQFRRFGRKGNADMGSEADTHQRQQADAGGPQGMVPALGCGCAQHRRRAPGGRQQPHVASGWCRRWWLVGLVHRSPRVPEAAPAACARAACLSRGGR